MAEPALCLLAGGDVLDHADDQLTVVVADDGAGGLYPDVPAVGVHPTPFGVRGRGGTPDQGQEVLLLWADVV